MRPIDPAKLVDAVLRDIVFEIDACPLAKVWLLAENYFHKGSVLTDFEKKLLWLWLSRETSNLEFFTQESKTCFVPNPVLEKNFSLLDGTDAKGSSDDSCGDTENHQDQSTLMDTRIFLKATSQLQWRILIGVDYSKRNIITDNIFPLVLAIAKTREQGIIQADLTKAANHDARSTTGRVAILLQYDIVFKFYSRHSPYPFLIHSYFKDKVRVMNNLKDFANSYEDQKLEILSAIKTAHNQIRSIRDIMEQFQCRKSPIAKKRFLNLINRLVEQGVLNRVQAVYDESGQTVPCIQLMEDPENLRKSLPNPNQENKSTNVEDGDIPFTTECGFFNNNVSAASQIFASIENSDDQSILSINLLKKHVNPVGNKMPAHLANLFAPCNIERLPTITKDASIDDFYLEYSIMSRYTFVRKVKYFLISNVFNELQKKLRSSGKSSNIYDASLVIDSNYDFFSDRFKNGFFSYTDMMKYMRLVKTENCPFYIFYDPDNISKKYVSWRYFPQNSQTHLRQIESKNSHSAETNSLIQISLPANNKNGSLEKSAKRSNDDDSDDLNNSPKKIKIESKNVVSADRPKLHKLEPVDSLNETLESNILKPKTVKNPLVAISKMNFSITKEKRLKNLLQYLKENNGVLLLKYEDVLELSRRMIMNTLVDRKTILRDVETLEDLGILKTKQTKIPGHKVCFMYFADHVFTADEKDRYFDTDQLFVKKKNYRKPIYEKSTKTVRLYELDPKSFRESRNLSSKNDKKDETPKEISVTVLAKEERQRIVENTLIVENRISQEQKVPRKKKNKNSKKEPVNVAGDSYSNDDFRLTAKKIKFTLQECNLICRCVIILRSLSKSRYSDFNSIAQFLDKPFITGKILKARWSSIKKCAIPSYNKLFANWKRCVLFGCEKGIISIKDLQRKDLSFFNNVWKRLELNHISKADVEIVGRDKSEKLKLSENHYANQQNFKFVSTNKNTDLDQYFEPISTFQREKILHSVPFTINKSEGIQAYNKTIMQNADDDSVTRQVLKAFVLSDKSNYTPKDALKLLSKFGISEQLMRNTLKVMENDKEISAVLMDGKTELILNDRLWNVCHPSRIFDQKMLKDACKFHMFLCSVSESKKAVQLPSDISNGAMMAVVSSMIEPTKNIELVRYGILLDSYMNKYSIKDLPETFLYTKFLLLFAENSSLHESILPEYPVPTGSPCSKIWIDVKGQVNKPIFLRILRLVLSLIHDRPGINTIGIYKKMDKLLSYKNLIEICDWLVSKNAIEKKEFDSLFTTNRFYGVFY